jgi:putative ABC transport system permease protein
MKTFMLHLQSSTRSLRRSFSSILPLILLLAAGCGIASSLLHDSGLIVQPSLSYANQDQLVRPVIRRAKGFSPDIPVDWIKTWSSAGSLSGFTPYSFIAGAVYQPTSSMSATRAVIVTAQPDILSLLGVAPIIGRSFDPKGAGYEVIISYDVWQRQFSGDPRVTTKSLLVNRRIYQVIGVMPEGFYFPAELHESTVWITQNDVSQTNRTTVRASRRVGMAGSKSI